MNDCGDNSDELDCKGKRWLLLRWFQTIALWIYILWREVVRKCRFFLLALQELGIFFIIWKQEQLHSPYLWDHVLGLISTLSLVLFLWKTPNIVLPLLPWSDMWGSIFAMDGKGGSYAVSSLHLLLFLLWSRQCFLSSQTHCNVYVLYKMYRHCFLFYIDIAFAF